ncbi:hypothetical protein HK099_004354 [Clydaea vesicula]|uniref:Mediator of RNA polymerase II transcription subunit 18 n=1 Tax=Clydaea vesicula TaxID=447962 RepID=A0AAD5U3C0_9FUNG|nr:hypothetical protein HK099_004354 [Clydaea vesicula]
MSNLLYTLSLYGIIHDEANNLLLERIMGITNNLLLNKNKINYNKHNIIFIPERNKVSEFLQKETSDPTKDGTKKKKLADDIILTLTSNYFNENDNKFIKFNYRNWFLHHLSPPEPQKSNSLPNFRVVNTTPVFGNIFKFLESLGYIFNFEYAEKGYLFEYNNIQIKITKIYTLTKQYKVSTAKLFEKLNDRWLVQLVSNPISQEASAKTSQDLLELSSYFKGWPLLLKRKKEELSIDTEKLTNKLNDNETYELKRQIQLDVDRSLSNFNFHDSSKDLVTMRSNLFDVIFDVFVKNPHLHYYQVLNEKNSKKVLSIFSNYYLRDLMEKNMDGTIKQMEFIYFLLSKLDPELYHFLNSIEGGSSPFFSLSWILTWFVHDNDFILMPRLFDFFLTHNPVIILYFSTILILDNKMALLNLQKDFSLIHQYLTNIKISKTSFTPEQNSIYLNKLIYTTLFYYQNHKVYSSINNLKYFFGINSCLTRYENDFQNKPELEDLDFQKVIESQMEWREFNKKRLEEVHTKKELKDYMLRYKKFFIFSTSLLVLSLSFSVYYYKELFLY